jgi:hypothetical protein
MSDPAFFIGKNFPARFLFLLLLHKPSWCDISAGFAFTKKTVNNTAFPTALLLL